MARKTEFHHHPDGFIFIRGDEGTYRADRETFDLDCENLGLPAYEGLPEGFIERRYDGTAHLLFSEDTQRGGPRWRQGDDYLRALPRFLQNQEQREQARNTPNPPDPDETPEQKRIREYPSPIRVLSALSAVVLAMRANEEPPAKALAVLNKMAEVDGKYPDEED